MTLEIPWQWHLNFALLWQNRCHFHAPFSPCSISSIVHFSTTTRLSSSFSQSSIESDINNTKLQFNSHSKTKFWTFDSANTLFHQPINLFFPLNTHFFSYFSLSLFSTLFYHFSLSSSFDKLIKMFNWWDKVLESNEHEQLSKNLNPMNIIADKMLPTTSRR